MIIDPHDYKILLEFEENLNYIFGGKGKLIFYDHEIKHFEKANRDQQKTFGTTLDPFEDFWGWKSGAFYKINAEGRITLIWCNPWSEPGCLFLWKIPDNLLELSKLKYLWFICVIKKELIPSTIRSNDLFEVQIRPITKESSLFELYIMYGGHTKHINIEDFFELEIMRKDLLNQIKNDERWFFEEAFKKE